VPCGSEYSHCKFIKDAYESIDLITISENSIKEYANKTNKLGEEIRELNYSKIEEYLAKYQKVLDKKNKTATNIAKNKINLERYKTEIFKNKSLLEDLLSKQEDYNKNKEVIENLEKLISKRNSLKKDISNKERESKLCNETLMDLYKTNGSLEEKLSANLEKKEEYEKCKVDFAAYDLLMTCCHPNGISYDIIKERLPIINQEIAKILTNIVEFEIFIKNEDKKLDIFIKHPKHDPRPLEMGSGAEKTIASMAIRLAFLTVTSLPKSDLFILDEPGTALDEENMEGFVRILDMVKNYFKTVILISHLDSLKDCVDMQINIEKQNGYAKVRI
jgi:exonuclease SbcC